MQTGDTLTLGMRVRRARRARGLQAQFVARQAGIGQSAYSAIENDWSMPKADTLSRIADALDASMDELMGRQKTFGERPASEPKSRATTLGWMGLLPGEEP